MHKFESRRQQKKKKRKTDQLFDNFYNLYCKSWDDIKTILKWKYFEFQTSWDDFQNEDISER
jgi:hypothetical protein